jgi:hydrogenase maturation protease
VTIIGVGNPDMGDDGVGVAIAERLSAEMREGTWRSRADVVCAERDPMLACAYLAEGKHVLVVDAVDMQAKPGTWRLFSGAEIAECALPDGSSSHTVSIMEVGALARALECPERLRVLGIQVAEVRPGRFLSDPVSRSVAEVLAKVREEAEALP